MVIWITELEYITPTQVKQWNNTPPLTRDGLWLKHETMFWYTPSEPASIYELKMDSVSHHFYDIKLWVSHFQRLSSELLGEEAKRYVAEYKGR